MTAHEDILKEARKIDTSQPGDTATPLAPPAEPITLDQNEQSTVMDSLGTFVSENPGPAVLIGAGLAWLFVNRERSRSRSLPVRLKERAHNVSATTKDSYNDVRATTAEAVDHAKEATVHSLENAKAYAKEKASVVNSRYSNMQKENPLALGACAMAVGLAIGLLIPPTRRENDLLGEARDSLMDQAINIVKEARNAAVASLRSSRDSVEEKLLEAKDEAQGAVEESVNEAKEAFKEELRADEASIGKAKVSKNERKEKNEQ